MRSILRSILFLAVSLFALPLAHAQSDRGGINGKVTDSSGAILPNTVVTLRNEATGVSQSASSNASGDYNFQLLNPGSYTLTVSLNGFKTTERTHVVVDVNQVNEQNIQLAVGATTETVEVSTGIQQLQTETASEGLIVEQRSIQELPLVYGNPFTLETLAPGLLVSGVNPNVHAYDSSTSNVSVNGSLLNSIEYRLDGAPDNRIRLSAYTPGTEFINQYKVETASYDATEGHSSGGFVNVSLKSGTNGFHGGVFGSYQNPDLNTSYWHLAASTPAKSTWLRLGGDIGGPIWRDRIFFFGGYEHSRETTPNVQSLTVPTDAERTGNFSELYSLGCAGYTLNSSGVAICPNGTVSTGQLYDPRSGKSVTGGVCGTGKTCTVRTPIPGNVITTLDPIAAKILSYYPHGGSNGNGTATYAYSGAEPNYYYAYVARIDANITSRQNVYGHYVQSRRLQPGKNAYFLPASGTSLVYNNKGIALGYTYTVTPATVLDAHLTWTRFINQSFTNSQGTGLNATTLGMPSYLLQPGQSGFANAFPRIDISPGGFTSLNSDNPVISHDDVTLGSIQISHLFGNHFLRGGVEYRMYNTNAGVGTQSNGRYQNTGVYMTTNSTNNAPPNAFGLAQLEEGIPTTSAVTVNSDLAVRSSYIAEYLQDDWKATSNLTVNLGLRFEYEGPNSERHQKANTFFDFNAVNPISAAAQSAYKSIAGTNPLIPSAANFVVNGGLRFLGDPTQNFGHQTYHPQVLNLLPRAGISWQFVPRTVFRAGFGIFDDSLSSFYLSGGNAGSTTTFLLPQQGFSQTTSLSSSPDSGLTFTSTYANPFPTGITAPTGSSLGLATALGQSVTFQPSKPKSPYNMRWSMGFQRQFGAWLGAVDYVGNHGLHLPLQRDYNAVPRQFLSTVTNGYDATENNNLSTTVNSPFFNLYPNAAKTISVAQLVRPYPEFGSVTAYITSGTSMYHSLQAQLNRRFAHGASLTSSFTWSKSLDATQYLNLTDAQPWYGLSQNDRTFRFATSGIYQLPFGPGRTFLSSPGIASAIVGGWQIQGVYQVQSGQPLSFQPSTSGGPLYTGPGDPSNSAWGRQGFKNSTNGFTKTGYWFNPAYWSTTTAAPSGSTGVVAGVTPNQYQIRTLGLRYSRLRADFLNQADVAVQRNFGLARVYEPLSLQIRLDMINALNHPVYGASGTGSVNSNPVTDWTQTTTFAEVISQSNQPRIYQFEAFIRF